MEQLSHRHRAKLEEILVQRERALREDIQRELIQQEDFAQVAGESPDPGDLSFADLSVDLRALRSLPGKLRTYLPGWETRRLDVVLPAGVSSIGPRMTRA